AETRRLFTEYDWPGNVRELENLIKRMVVLGTEAPISREIQKQQLAAATHRVPAAVIRSTPNAGHGTAAAQPGAARANGVTAAVARSPVSIATAAIEAGNYSLKDISRTAAREAERELILKMLNQTRWNRKETAEILGISYKALLYKIKENGLDKV